MIGNVAFTIAILAVVLGVLVFVHELGHYLAAKAFGVWVHRFAIGIGKPIPGLTFQRGETEWAIAWLPLGGYVKMASRERDPASSVLEGESSDAVPPDRVFEAKPIWQRIVIILSGVTLNIVFALVVFSGLAWKNGRRYDPTTTLGHVNVASLPAEARGLADVPAGTRIVAVDGHAVASWDEITERIAEGNRDTITITFSGHDALQIPLHRDALSKRAAVAGAIEPEQAPVFAGVTLGSPARQAGLQPGDSVVAVDGQRVQWWSEVVDRVQPSIGRPLDFEVARPGGHVHVTVTPRGEHQVPGDTTSPIVGRIGVAARTRYLTQPLSLVGAISAGAHASVSSAGTIFRTLRGLTTGRVSTRDVGGPILIGQMAADEARQGIEPLLAFMALISVNLAIVNLLPIPVLDGGAVVFLLYEAVARRALPTRLREALSLAGLALVVLLMVIAFKNDIFRMFGH